jgi:protein-S-isoprenylcysteine O-methyltransferase Ste14
MQLPSPNIFNILLIITIILHFIIPTPKFSIPFQETISLLQILCGLSLNLWANIHLRKNKTTTEFGETPIKLVIDGPFSFSRNPLYLGAIVLVTGISVWFGSYLILSMAIMMFIVLNWVYIPLEEAFLLDLFGEEYISYQKQVNRWL